jgi:CheY-like chemotaxis protein
MVPQQLPQPRPGRILVVEDEVLIRAFIAEELRLVGFSVIEARRADDALTYIIPKAPLADSWGIPESRRG